MRFVTVKIKSFQLHPAVHLREREWQPECLRISDARIVRGLDFVNEPMDDEFAKSLEQKSFSL